MEDDNISMNSTSSWYTDDEEDILNEMYSVEERFDLEEKENGKYYLGVYMHIQDIQIVEGKLSLVGDKLFFENVISVESFFKYKYSHVITYLRPIMMSYQPVVDIMQLIISEEGFYLAVIKTSWISLIQRHWKKIMEKKREYMEYQKSFQYIRNREMGIRNTRPVGLSLYGMLSIYKKCKSNTSRIQV